MLCVETVNQTIIATELEWKPAADFTANHDHSLAPAVYSPPASGDYTAVQKQSNTVRELNHHLQFLIYAPDLQR